MKTNAFPANWNVFTIYYASIIGLLSKGVSNEMKMWPSQLWSQFTQMQIKPEKSIFGASTGFERVASAFALQCLSNWAWRPIHWKQANLLSSPYAWKEWNIEWKWCKLRKCQWNEDVTIAVVTQFPSFDVLRCCNRYVLNMKSSVHKMLRS